jgi:hypothetical protein
MIDPAPIRDRFTALSPHLNERERRLFAATEAAAAGYGGIAAVSAATGIAVSTIGRGLKDLAEADGVLAGRVRRVGGGRKPLVVSNPDLLRDLMALVEPGARGDPMSPCAGPARACDGWRLSLRHVGIGSVAPWSVNC